MCGICSLSCSWQMGQVLTKLDGNCLAFSWIMGRIIHILYLDCIQLIICTKIKLIGLYAFLLYDY